SFVKRQKSTSKPLVFARGRAIELARIRLLARAISQDDSHARLRKAGELLPRQDVQRRRGSCQSTPSFPALTPRPSPGGRGEKCSAGRREKGGEPPLRRQRPHDACRLRGNDRLRKVGAGYHASRRSGH